MATVKDSDTIRSVTARYASLVQSSFPGARVFLYGSYAKGSATGASDIDIAVVLDIAHGDKIEYATRLFGLARKVDVSIEPFCVFRDEYDDPPAASILSEIKRTAIPVAA
ncbi:MAG: nucleotidyltransferase domain-containing protein [Spirochaetota bacterium]